MMGPLETLTPVEKEAYYELKKRVSDNVPQDLRDDFYLYLRFLRARDFNITQSEDMLRNHLEWRKQNQIDTPSFQQYVPDKVLARHLPLGGIGYDNDGAPVNFIDFGCFDIKGLLKSYKKSEVIKAIVRTFEDDIIKMKQQSEKVGKPIEQWVYIFDYNNYSLAKATHKQTLETLISIFMIYEANYPERLKAAYLINASYYFTLVFQVIKPLLSGATLKKVKIFGKDGWKDSLTSIMNPDVLPGFLGGRRCDPDGNPKCLSFVKHGVLVPEEYYITRSTVRLNGQPGVQKLIVSRMSKSQLKFQVTEPSSTLEWEFETESRDIAFTVLFKDNDQVKEVIPKERIDAHLTSEIGMVTCDKPGMYVLVFDNSYSWIHQKEIYCRVAVVTPKENKITMIE